MYISETASVHLGLSQVSQPGSRIHVQPGGGGGGGGDALDAEAEGSQSFSASLVSPLSPLYI